MFATQAQFDGYALYNNQNASTAYLIDASGAIAHSWSLPSNANYAMAIKPNGNLVRGAVNVGNQLNGAAVGGKVQEFTPAGALVWEFVYSTSSYVSHHDICLMPNGNVLLTAWFVQTNAQLQALGYTGTSAKWPTRIIEVQQNGSGGEVVWEWNMLDRFIQYVDASKPNYMPIAEHPERMNINVAIQGGGGPGGGGDWFHSNGIDYNEGLDQIAFSSRYASEIFVIDHSTTTAEAAGHSAGNAGKGGDFLFRWGKPANYGTMGTQTIAGAVHDVRWIKDGRPNAGYLQFVNNVGGPSGNTVIDAIDPPLNGYNYDRTPNTAFGPTVYDWRHVCLANSSGQSASDRMPNGNIFVALSDEYMYEVDESGTIVWQYNASPPKAFRYLCADPGIIAILGTNVCTLTTEVNEIGSEILEVYPNPSNGAFLLSGVDASQVASIAVVDGIGRSVRSVRNTLLVDLSDQAEGIYHMQVTLGSGQRIMERIVVQR
ncbi:MAG: aryl-sulfate sulfotransferase [Flavobacteriales bacterium]|nr:aryl-sulfate sulfotransferase [Flavobacteriales bacterium]MBK7238831.1 aryl-sulfate sulfotransferase [Flavobacteriales bacterium]MBK9537044.1 aryl-sulfate sulfotransferase [Flavobacteriales bacterium]MBP9139726.1 aryl-sulfate sulfotransferase [Flavobacteriales bacterium]HQX29993.1 aryl-sulfate sulfotransferase [Flavobacteriales bacterium]